MDLEVVNNTSAALRGAGVIARLGNPGSWGLADLAMIVVTGPDAGSYLHGQTTNDVEGLEIGDWNESALVSRTGHLEALFTVHRVDEETFWLVGERCDIAHVGGHLEKFLFADDVEVRNHGCEFAAIIGDASQRISESAIDARSIQRPLVGEAAIIFPIEPEDSLMSTVVSEGQRQGATYVSDISPALELLRLESGDIRVSTDFGDRRRLLPETGMENRTVSYSKGCYVGQEVIARARTYGSMPWSLRAISFDKSVATKVGDDVVTSSGKKVGKFSSSGTLPVVGGVVSWAFLGRDFRTPGSKMELNIGDEVVEGEVHLLPLFRGVDLAEKVTSGYDSAVRLFAGGDAAGAMSALENILSIDPSFKDAYELVGVMMGKQGRWHEAVDFFRRLEEIAPDEPMVNTNLSVAYMKLGDTASAEEQAAAGTAKRFSAMNRGERTVAEFAKDQRDFEIKMTTRKLAMFQRVLSLDPDDSVALFGVGSAQSTLGEWGAAVTSFERAVAVDKNNSAAWLGWGKALEANDQPSIAETVYKDGIVVASKRGDLMPLREMRHRVMILEAAKN